MKLSRDWLSDSVDLLDLSNDELQARFTEIGHAVDSVERHDDDTIFDLEITTNRVDAMSHLGMARELGAALGREMLGEQPAPPPASENGSVRISIEAPEMCGRFSAIVVRGITIKPSPEIIRRRLEAIGLRPINNIVDVTNYVMMALGHPLHAYDLARINDATITVRPGKAGERLRTLDNEERKLDPQTCVIADPKHPLGLGGVIGGLDSEISDSTRDIVLECAWFNPSVIRRTAKRLGIKTDASYRFERRVDPGDTLRTLDLAASLVVEYAGGTREEPIDVLAMKIEPKVLVLRDAKLHEASAGVVGAAYALELFRRLGFEARVIEGGIEVVVPTWRGDIHEEMDLVEEVLRFFGLNNVPASLPRVTIGDTHENPVVTAEDTVRDILVGSGLAEAVNYSFIHPDHNPLFSGEPAVAITNALSENVGAMRLSLLPGLLETVVFNRSYGTRDGSLFEVGRTYHRDGDKVRERHRAAMVMYGSIGEHWGDARRPVDFFDIKGLVEQIAAKLHVELEFAPGDEPWLRKGKRAVGRVGDQRIATVGFLASEVLQKFGIKGEVAAAELDIGALLEATGEWKMTQVARIPGVPMIMALTHGLDLEYRRIVETIRSLDVPNLHEVGLRDRYPTQDGVKTTLGLWYQSFERSLTQDEVSEAHNRLGERLAALLPVKLLAQETR
ncbi:MAG TPA: phenylalanine--tRNA ligase subunit beta [Thermoanaerobaculia bacterium]|nr:phenylalanine--tRNA ligase subunit beta [Thermoanaerobaculia bacterium]